MEWFLLLGNSAQTCTNFPENCKCSCVGYRGKASIIPSIHRPILNFQYSFQLIEGLHSTFLWHFQVLNCVYFLENEVVSRHMFGSILTINWLTPYFPGGSNGKESACSVGDLGLIPGLGRYPGEGKGYPLQYSGLGNSMDRGAWQATVRGVAKSQTRLRDFHFSILTWAFWKQFLCNAWGVDFSCNLINSHVNAKYCWGRRNYV